MVIQYQHPWYGRKMYTLFKCLLWQLPDFQKVKFKYVKNYLGEILLAQIKIPIQ